MSFSTTLPMIPNTVWNAAVHRQLQRSINFPLKISSDCSEECFGEMQAGRADGTSDGALQPEASRWLEDEGVL